MTIDGFWMALGGGAEDAVIGRVMSSVHRWLLWLMACAWVGGVAGAAGREKWMVYRAPHFELLSDSEAAGARRVIEQMERYRAAIEALPGGFVVDRRPTRVYLIESDAILKQVLPSHAAAVAQMAPSENLLMIGAEQDRAIEGRVTLHEFTHLLNRRRNDAWPSWLHEGVAEALATAELESDRVTFGQPQVGWLQYLKSHRWLPWGTVLSPRSLNFEESTSGGLHRFYAQSWLLTLFLYFGRSRAKDPGTEKFFRLVGKGGDSVVALQEGLGLDEAGLTRELENYMRAGNFGHIEVPFPKVVIAQLPSRPANPGEAKAWLGDWCVFSEKTLDAADRFYAESLKAAPANPEATLGLGRVALKRKNFVEAERLLREAVRLEPSRAAAHYWLGKAILASDTGESMDDVLEDGRSVPAGCVTEFREATELDPEMGAAWKALGLVLIATPTPGSEPLVALRKAWELSPGDYSLMVAQARCLLRRGMRDQAVPLLEEAIRVKGSSPVGRSAARLLNPTQL